MLKKLTNSEKFEIFLRKKESFVKKSKNFFLSTLGLEKLRLPLIKTVIWFKWAMICTFEVVVNGAMLYMSIFWTIGGGFKRVVGLGVAMCSLTVIAKKLWRSYVLYRFRLNKIAVTDLTQSRYSMFKKSELKKKGVEEEDK